MTVSHVDMDQNEINALVSEPRFGMFATNRRDGPPQMSPVWYLYQDDCIYVSVFEKSAKCRNLVRDPRATLCVSGDSPDARAVIFSGPVELHSDRDAEPWIKDIAWKIVRRYYDSDAETQEYLDAEGGTGSSTMVVLKPDRVLAHNYN
ncbi:MAG: PPOX class F420-dependent oxidoreductase [Pseudomonadales bacterium]